MERVKLQVAHTLEVGLYLGHTKTIGTEANLVDMTQIGQESVSPAVDALTVYPKEASTLLVIIAKKIIGSDRISVIVHLAVQMLLETRQADHIVRHTHRGKSSKVRSRLGLTSFSLQATSEKAATAIKNSFRRLDTDYLTEILRTHLPTFTI